MAPVAAGAETAFHRKESTVTHSHTTVLMTRLPRWFVEQARAVDARARRSQEMWEETRRRNNALALQRAVEAKAGGRAAWQDTVAEFKAG